MNQLSSLCTSKMCILLDLKTDNSFVLLIIFINFICFSYIIWRKKLLYLKRFVSNGRGKAHDYLWKRVPNFYMIVYGYDIDFNEMNVETQWSALERDMENKIFCSICYFLYPYKLSERNAYVENWDYIPSPLSSIL